MLVARYGLGELGAMRLEPEKRQLGWRTRLTNADTISTITSINSCALLQGELGVTVALFGDVRKECPLWMMRRNERSNQWKPRK